MTYLDQMTASREFMSNEDVVFGALEASSAEGRWVDPTQEIARLIADSFSRVPQVAAIFAELRSDVTTIWTLLDSPNREAREKIYELELEICDRLSIFGLDFKVTSVDLVAPDVLFENGLTRIFSR